MHAAASPGDREEPSGYGTSALAGRTWGTTRQPQVISRPPRSPAACTRCAAVAGGGRSTDAAGPGYRHSQHCLTACRSIDEDGLWRGTVPVVWGEERDRAGRSGHRKRAGLPSVTGQDDSTRRQRSSRRVMGATNADRDFSAHSVAASASRTSTRLRWCALSMIIADHAGF